MEVGRITYSPDYESAKPKQHPVRFLTEPNRCGCCGTKGGVKFVKSFGDNLCPECRIEWRDYSK